MQCLYCDTELKPFRGLFDEDFCSREHREKYLSSFRKALTGFGGLQEQVQKTTGPAGPAPSAPAPDPRTADFQPISVLPLINEVGRDTHPPELLTASHGVEIPDREIAWSVVLDFEERPADLVAPSEGTFGILDPAPPLHDSSPRLPAELGGGSEALSLETAGPAISGENDSVPGCHTPWICEEPMSPPPAQLSMPPVAVSAGAPALAPTPADEYADVTLFCQQLQSAPVPNSEIAAMHETHIPAFTPAGEMLQGDDQRQVPDATEPYWGELYSDPEPGGVDSGSSLAVAAEMGWTSVPVDDRPVRGQDNLPVMMLPSLELASTRSGASAVELQPHLAGERATDFVDGDAVDSSAVPRSHEPLKLTFGNLVKIKNWRLRITFAKPA